jgi:hypothetical protein
MGDVRSARVTRMAHGSSCPLGFTAPKRPHIWIETTLPSDSRRSFGCDCCQARAQEGFEVVLAKIGGDA